MPLKNECLLCYLMLYQTYDEGPFDWCFITTCTQIRLERNIHHHIPATLVWWLICVEIKILTHWGRVTHICVGNLTIIGSDNGLSPGRRQAIIWTNAGILLIGPLGTDFNEISIESHTFLFKKMYFNMSSAKWRPFCLGLNVLTHWGRDKMAAISHTTFSNAFSWMKMYEFRLRYHWSLFLWVQSTIFQHWFSWRRYTSLGLSGVIKC